MVGWVKPYTGTIYVGFAYHNATQQFELETKLANPTRLVADRRLNPTYNLSFRPTGFLTDQRKPIKINLQRPPRLCGEFYKILKCPSKIPEDQNAPEWPVPFPWVPASPPNFLLFSAARRYFPKPYPR